MINKPFRLKDPKTGLYYCPSREVMVKWKDKSCRVRSNLSKTGKVYFKSYEGDVREIEDHTDLEDYSFWPFVKSKKRRAVKFEVEYLD